MTGKKTKFGLPYKKNFMQRKWPNGTCNCSFIVLVNEFQKSNMDKIR